MMPQQLKRLRTIPRDLGPHGYSDEWVVHKCDHVTRAYSTENQLSHAGAALYAGRCIIELKDGCQYISFFTTRPIPLGTRVITYMHRDVVPGWGRFIGARVLIPRKSKSKQPHGASTTHHQSKRLRVVYSPKQPPKKTHANPKK